jgi:hypothetical protein
VGGFSSYTTHPVISCLPFWSVKSVISTKLACDGYGLHCDSSFPGSLPTAAAACCYDGFHIKIDSLYNINVNLSSYIIFLRCEYSSQRCVSNILTVLGFVIFTALRVYIEVF